ncbi:hypothetical protein BOW39_11115, partial [Solemya velum gill symbiont]
SCWQVPGFLFRSSCLSPVGVNDKQIHKLIYSLVAAYPVTGPVDFIVNGVNGYCNPDLQAAVERSLKLDRAKVRGHVVAHYSWQHVTDLFEDALIHIEDLKSRI